MGAVVYNRESSLASAGESTCFKTKFKTKVAVLAAALVLIAGGAAFAYWTSGGTGTGTAATGTSAAVNAVQTSVVADMVPGDSQRRPSAAPSPTPTPSRSYVTAVTREHRRHRSPRTCAAVRHL